MRSKRKPGFSRTGRGYRALAEALEGRTLLSVTPVPFQHFTIDPTPGLNPLEKLLLDAGCRALDFFRRRHGPSKIQGPKSSIAFIWLDGIRIKSYRRVFGKSNMPRGGRPAGPA